MRYDRAAKPDYLIGDRNYWSSAWLVALPGEQNESSDKKSAAPAASYALMCTNNSALIVLRVFIDPEDTNPKISAESELAQQTSMPRAILPIPSEVFLAARKSQKKSLFRDEHQIELTESSLIVRSDPAGSSEYGSHQAFPIPDIGELPSDILRDLIWRYVQDQRKREQNPDSVFYGSHPTQAIRVPGFCLDLRLLAQLQMATGISYVRFLPRFFEHGIDDYSAVALSAGSDEDRSKLLAAVIMPCRVSDAISAETDRLPRK